MPAVQALLEDLGGAADSFVCGGAGFVEAASALLLEAGQRGHAIRTERFGRQEHSRIYQTKYRPRLAPARRHIRVANRYQDPMDSSYCGEHPVTCGHESKAD